MDIIQRLIAAQEAKVSALEAERMRLYKEMSTSGNSQRQAATVDIVEVLIKAEEAYLEGLKATSA